MIEIKVTVGATLMVSPKNWDSAEGLEASITNALHNCLGQFGHDLDIEVQASVK